MIGLEKEYKQTFDNFGFVNQVHKLDEEMDELMDAVKALKIGGNVSDAEQELADVINVAMQFIIKYGGSGEAILSQCVIKMHRTEKRVKAGFYD